jgi:hypothetical protein
MVSKDEITDTERLLRHVTSERREAFLAYVRELVDNDVWGIDGAFLGFMEDYEYIASLLVRKAQVKAMPLFGVSDGGRLVVYDVGCATALQHVFFDNAIEYVGIDFMQPEPRFFRDGCRYVSGRFSEVVTNGSLAIDRKYAVGVANMSLLYCAPRSELEAFDAAFDMKIVL